MRLFTPRWQSTDPQKRLKGIEKLTDQQILFDLCFDVHSTIDIRLACLQRIHDQQMLAELAQNNLPEVTRAAFSRVHIKALIREIAENAAEWSIRKEAWIKLGETERAMVEEATHTPKFHRLLAVQKIQTPALLAQVAVAQESEAFYQTYGYAIEQIEDQQLLLEIVREAVCGRAALLAAERIGDQQVLERIAADRALEPPLRIIAIRQLYNKPLLLRLTEEREQVKAAAIQRLEEL